MRNRIAVLFLLLSIFLSVGYSSMIDQPYRDRMGFSVCFRPELTRLDDVHALGTWVRIPCNWNFVEPVEPDPLIPDNQVWGDSALDDAYKYPDPWVFKAQQARDSIILCIGTTPKWARPGVYQVNSYLSCDDNVWDVAPALAQASDWGAFCGAVAAHYGSQGIHYYEIWNEPNLEHFYATAADSSMEYADLLRIAAESIIANDSQAVIITGGLAPYSRTGTPQGQASHRCISDTTTVPHPRNYHISAREWLQDLYAHSFPDSTPIIQYFKAVGYHPYAPITWSEDNWGGPTQEEDGLETLRYSFVEAIYDSIMCPHNDGAKKIWGTETGFNDWHDPCGQDEIPLLEDCEHKFSYSTYIQSLWVNEYFSKWNDWSFTGPLLWFQIHDNDGDPNSFSYGIMHGSDTTSDPDSLKPSYNELLNWASGKAEYHVGDDASSFSYTNWNVDNSNNGVCDLSDLIKSTAQYADTISIFIHETTGGYADILSDLDFRSLPDSLPFRCLKLMAAGQEFDDPDGHVVFNFMNKSIQMGSRSLIIEDFTFSNIDSNSSPIFGPLVCSSGDIIIRNCNFTNLNTNNSIIVSEGNNDNVLSLSDCTFSDIQADDEIDYWKAIISTTCNLLLKNSTFSNITNSRGIISSDDGVEKSIDIDNCMFSNNESDQFSIINSLFDIHIKNCLFSQNTYPQGVIGMGGVTLGDSEIRDPQVTSIEHTIFGSNSQGSGEDPLALLNPLNALSIQKCTFDANSYSLGEARLRAGCTIIANSIFKTPGTGNQPSITKQPSYQSTPTIQYCLFNQEQWAPTFLASASTTGIVLVNHAQSDSKIGFVDPSALDYRLRWDNVCMDQGDPDSLDFDLTNQDIGWSPWYPVTEITGNATIQERGWYRLIGNTTLVSGTGTDLVIPDGTIILCDGAYELAIQDTNPSNGYRITVGDSTGARTSLVSHELGSLTFGSTSMEYTTVTTNGVLFNRGPDWCTGWGFVWFNTCNVNLDGQSGNTKFNNYDHTTIIFDNFSSGTIHNIDFTAEQAYPALSGIGQIEVFGSGLVIDNLIFDPLLDLECYFDHKLCIGFMNPNATANVISNCQFVDAEPNPGKSLVFLYGCNSYWHHNAFDDVRDAAINMSCCTARMNNIAANDFSRTYDFDNRFDLKPLIQGYLGYLDLNCGYNSFVVSQFLQPTKFVTASSGTTDWSSNYWGQACDLPVNPIGRIPTFVTNVSPTLPECPTAVFEDPCGSQQSPSALYTSARSAHTNGNYPASISYWNELLLLYPYTPNSMEACNAMKAIGVWTEFGAESYSAIASMLDTIAVVSLPLNTSLSLHEYCNGLCVEGRHGDRQAVISAFDSLLVAFAGKKDEVEDIQISRAEVLGYPLQGQSSALSDPFATRAHRRQAIRNLLNVMAGRDEDATGTVLEAAVASLPATFRIRSVHPNPFNPVTTLELELSRESLLRVEVFNLMGQRVASVHDGPAPAGGLHLAIDGAGWASGVYFVRVQVDRKTETRKILLTR